MSEFRSDKIIAFDAQPLLSNSKSGVGFHEAGLVKGMMQQHQKNNYLLDVFSWKDRENKRKILAEYLVNENVHLNECRWFPGTLYRMIWGILPFPYCFFFGKKADITHFFNFCIPPGVHGKKVVTIHDMAFHRYPETIRKKTKIMLAMNLRKSIKRADAIIAVSEFTKNEIQKFYKVPSEKIYVIPNGVDLERFHPKYTMEEKSRVKEKYGISKKYFLFMGNVEPRKNLVRLVEAYFKAKEQYEGEFPVLVIGGAKGWLCDEIYQMAERDGKQDKIRFAGYIADEDVPILMSGAEVFCFVSLYEGFGMPVLEAMACGTPVLTSCNSALAEVAGDAAVKVNPKNVDEIADALVRLYRDNELRENCMLRGISHAREYSWENASCKLYEVYERISESL